MQDHNYSKKLYKESYTYYGKYNVTSQTAYKPKYVCVNLENCTKWKQSLGVQPGTVNPSELLSPPGRLLEFTVHDNSQTDLIEVIRKADD